MRTISPVRVDLSAQAICQRRPAIRKQSERSLLSLRDTRVAAAHEHRDRIGGLAGEDIAEAAPFGAGGVAVERLVPGAEAATAAAGRTALTLCEPHGDRELTCEHSSLSEKDLEITRNGCRLPANRWLAERSGVRAL